MLFRSVAEFTGVNPDKIVVTYEAADRITEPAEPIKNLEGKKFIMYIGRPTPHKNLGRLIDTFKLMQERDPELYLVLAGKKDVLYEKHEAYAQKNGIKNIIFTGFITDGQLRWLYEHTACYVFPSLSEGFGLPGLEAMTHGAPVASSNFTCLPEVYGGAALYFNPLNTNEIGERVLEIISDKNLSAKLKKLGKEQAEKYSWKRMAKQTLEVYNRALQD